MASFENTINGRCTSKHYRMKQVVSAMQEYFQSKREETAMTINMHLQSLSLTIDLSIFDPHNTVVAQFFVSLYELMNKMEERSAFAWNCVDVLSNACRNPSARHALIHTYQFIPALSRLLGDQISMEKKTRLLRLMQDLTCGIKISWQIPHLPQLMITLTQWIESPDEEIVSLSLAILVNLCYKNLPAVYTLMGNVNVKKILQVCTNIQRKSVEIHTCKLLMILDFMNGDIPITVLQKVVSVTFDSIPEAFRMRDPILLRQIVEFFLDVGKQNSRKIPNEPGSCENQLKHLLDCVTENNCCMEAGDTGSDTRDPECVALIFEFLNFLIEIKLAATPQFYPLIIDLALKWIQTDLVSSQALAALKSIAIKVDQSQNEILEPLVNGLPIFLMSLNHERSESSPVFVEQKRNISGVLQLLRTMVQVSAIRQKIIKDLKVEMVCRVFEPLLGEQVASGFKANDSDAGNIDNINLFIHGVALVNELAKHDPNWLNMRTNLFEHRQIHMVISQGLYESSVEVKTVIFELISNANFPRKSIAETMSTIQPFAAMETSKTSSAALETMNFPVLSVSHVKRIEELLAKFEGVFAQRQEGSILTSDVIELYEYKLAAMGNAERAAMNSVEAASERCTHLQHRNAQLSAELNRLHQLLFHVQQQYEQTTKLKNTLQETVDKLTPQVEVSHGKLKALKKEVDELKWQLNENKETYDKLLASKNQLDEQHSKLKQVVTRLEDNCSRLEKIVQKKEIAIKKCNDTIDNFNLKNAELEEKVSQKEAFLQQKLTELKDVTAELKMKQGILDTITKYAMNSQHQHHSGLEQ